MPTPVTDTFDNIRQLSGYDEPGTDVPSLDANLTAILAGQVVNLRAFNDVIYRLRTQGDLDDEAQNTPLPNLPSGLDNDTNLDVEQVIKVPPENWTALNDANGPNIVNSTGITGNLVSGKIAAFKNWRGATVTLAGGIANIRMESAMDAYPIDISGLGKLSAVIHTPGTGTVSQVLIRLLDQASADSGEVSMTNDTGHRWIVADTSTIPNVDMTKITRVVLHIITDGGPTAADLLYVLAVRAHNAAYDPSHGFGLNTTRAGIGVPVTFDLADPSNLVPEVVRGVGAPNDLSPEDAEVRMLIRAGDLDFATGVNYNIVDLTLRQRIGADSYILVRFKFNDTDAKWSIVSRAAGVNTTILADTAIGSTAYDAIIGGVDATGYFWIDAILRGQTLTFEVHPSDANEEFFAAPAYTHAVTDTRLSKARGRVGFGFTPIDRDVLLLDYVGVILGLSSFTTKTFTSLTPVEAVQLFGAFAPDINLFTSFLSGATQDTVRTLSGNPSWTGTHATSNEMIVPDLNQAYTSFDIWVPADATGTTVYLRLKGVDAGTTDITLPPLDDLQVGIWNRVEIDLSPYAQVNLATYQLLIFGASDFTTPLTWNFNIDYMTVGHRRVAWYAASDADGEFYPFRDCVNDEDSALHFPRVNRLGHAGRGTALQVRGEALTEDAWVSNFHVKVKYSELGKPIYY